jgi:PhnB protein
MKFPDSAIAHSNVRIAGSDIMMSDSAPAETRSTLALRWCSTRRTSMKANAGSITWPLAENRNGLAGNLLGHGFGKVTDKYGVPWMINVVKQQQPPQVIQREASLRTVIKSAQLFKSRNHPLTQMSH